jgi:hypothetical protein
VAGGMSVPSSTVKTDWNCSVSAVAFSYESVKISLPFTFSVAPTL